MVVIPETNTPGQADDDAYFDEMFISFSLPFESTKAYQIRRPRFNKSQCGLISTMLYKLISSLTISDQLSRIFTFFRLQKNDDSLVPKDGHKIACTIAAVEMIFSWATWYGFNLDW